MVSHLCQKSTGEPFLRIFGRAPGKATRDQEGVHVTLRVPLPTRHLTAGQVLRFRDDAFQTYFRSPAYLAHVERTFGAATRREIEAMTAQRLERRYAA